MTLSKQMNLLVEGSKYTTWTFNPPQSGWKIVAIEGGTLVCLMRSDKLKVIVTGFLHNNAVWIHASCSRNGELPSYADM